MVCEVSMVSIIFMYVVLLLCCNVCLLCSARDTLTHADPLTDDGSATLVSAEGTFELGFFNLPGSHGRFVGIWYHKLAPKTAVWIFNRENPVPAGVTGRLTINEGKLCLLDSFSGETIFPTLIGVASPFNMIVKLMETGNLVLMDSDQKAAKTLWQSFENPTDTFIPGMVMDDSFQLTSWRRENDPGGGNFSFKLDQDENQYIILKNNLIPHWKSGESGNTFSSYEMNPRVHLLLSRNVTNDVTFNYTRLVMNYTGQLQFLTWDDKKKQWPVSWLEPKDQCSVFNRCGNFSSCNNNNRPFICKCLPGFSPISYEDWNSGDFSRGCRRKSTLSSNNNTFLRLTMMKVKEADLRSNAGNETECSNTCLANPLCQAYSYVVVTENIRKRENSITTSKTFCWTWSEDLNNLVEEYDSGHNVSVRVALSDIESTVRDCKPCGTTMIPYPLSTGPDCGDPTYFSFNCNNLTGQVSFIEPKNAFRVISIDPSSRKFKLLPAGGLGRCPTTKGQTLQLNPLSPFKIISWCQADLGDISSEALSYVNVVELSWELPPEPICNTTEDCKGWLNSTCKSVAKDQIKRCYCDIGSWSGTNFNCTQVGSLQEPSQPSSGENSDRKVRFYLIIVAGAIGMILLACVASIYIWRRTMRKKQDKINRAQFDSERRVLELIDTSEFNKEDEKGIDVPFFDFQSILEATENFSEANKLGQGGYGPVYKGKFHGDQEIAVKRLSKVSGQGLQEFRNEVVLIAKLQHRNLVRLKGYCMKGEEKILLYEYMPNKSLDSFIFDHRKSVCLNWEMRYNIILGVARGLLYLHQDSRLRIVHRDLKTSNVLLDEEMNPKISDFGLARIVGGKETGANTNTVVGTYGYMSPEYALDGTFSIKSDVFSFGVVLLEIISGRKNAGFYQSKQTFSLICHAWELWTEDKVLDLIDKNLQESCDRSEFIKCVNVALLCVQEDPVDRPTMSNVITLLDSEAAIPATPKQPAFFIRRGSSSSGSASTSTKPEAVSEITTLEGR